MIINNPHIIPPQFPLKKTLESKIGTVYIYDSFMVFEAREGVVMSYKSAFPFLMQGSQYLVTKNWVYVSNRINSYAIKPMDYKYFNDLPNLRAMAIVYYNDIAQSNAVLEAKFCQKPFQMFDNIAAAFEWGNVFL